jgi:S1-C subfamily serine protease
VLVRLVYKDSPVFYANIVRGDIIVRVNDSVINNEIDEDSFNAGDEIEIEFIRNNQAHTATIKLATQQ